MAKANIEKVFKKSKDVLDKEHAAFADTIRKDLNKFKKETLSKV